MTSVRRRILVIGLVVPSALLAVALGVMVWSLPDLPDPVAVHWGPAGTPDGFGSPVLSFVLLPGIILAWLVFAWFLVRRTPDAGPTVNQKLVLAVGVFLAAYLGTIIAGSFVIQRGAEDARDTGSILPVMLVGGIVGVVLAAIAWFVLPKATAPAPIPPLDELPARAIGENERVVWVRRIEPSTPALAIVLAVSAVVLIAGAAIVAATQPLLALIAVLPLALIGLGYAVSFWTVTIDRRGVLARGGPGWPTIRLPLSDIEAARAIEVEPVIDFGGWGLRWAPGRTGIIVRRGPALEVRRRSGRDLVVTTPDAETAAELVNGLLQRARS